MSLTIKDRSCRPEAESAPTRNGVGERGISDEISLSDLIHVIQRRRRVIIISMISLLLLGAIYCVVKTSRYEAVADLAINPEGSNSLDMGDITSSLGAGGLGFDEKLETQVRILSSKSLAWTVIEELRLDREPTFAGHRKYVLFGPRVCNRTPDKIEQTSPAYRNELLMRFDKSLTVRTIPRTQAVEITFRNSNPKLACAVVNHLASAYTQRTFATRYEDTMKASDWLSGQLAHLKSSVEESQGKLSAFQKQTGIFGTDENNNLVLSKLDDLGKEVTDAEADRMIKEAKYHVAQSSNPELIATIAPDSVLPVLRGQEADLKNQLAQATSEFGPHYAKVIQLSNQLAQVQKSLQKENADIRERFGTEYKVADGTAQQLRTAFEKQRQQALNMSEGLDQYGTLKREVESGNDLYDDLLKKLKEAGVVASLKAANVEVIDLPTLPTEPVEPKIPLVLALSVVLGLGIGVGLAFAFESLDNMIRSPEEISALTSVSLFGMIPHMKKVRTKNLSKPGEEVEDESRQDSLVTLLRPTSHASEAFRSLRTSLLLASPGNPPKTVLVASAVPGEGKTTLCMNLAGVLTQWGARVLLVDADLRRGSVAGRANLEMNFGLSGALTGAGNWRDAVLALPEAPNLFILQSGLRPPNSSELLGSLQMNDFIEEWKAEYDQVIIDSPPCLLVTDSVLLAQRTDVVLLVSRIAVTPRSSLRQASELLSGDGHISGIVVNDVGVAESHYGYTYGYGYGYGNKGRESYYAEEEC